MYSRSPGPAQYTIPPSIGYKGHNKTKWIMPAYSIGKKLPKTDGSALPGPKYMTRDQTRFGQHTAPAYSIKFRPSSKAPPKAPGPGAYSPEKFEHKNLKRRAPLYSFGTRHVSTMKSLGPGPANYNTRKDNPPGPAYTILPKRPMKLAEGSPGPAAYVPDYNKVKHRSPLVKINERHSPVPKQFGPGPGAYNYNTIKGRNMPKFSFGMKHKDWMSPYILPGDNACTIKRAE